MKSNANKITFGLLSAFLILVLVLVFSAMGTGGGGGSGASAPSTSNTLTASSDNGKTYEQLRDELLARLSEGAKEGVNPRSANASSGVISTAALNDQLQQNGFENINLESTFDLDGTYVGERNLQLDSNEKYPSYSFTYISPSNICWKVICNDGQLFATPVGSSEDFSISKEIILTESDVVVQYDGVTNRYSDFGFDELANSGVSVVRVQTIDKTTLDSYDKAAMERL